jgi:hypothetical protein
MATEKIQLNGVRIQGEVFNLLKLRHEKEARTNKRTGNKESFSRYIERMLGDVAYERKMIEEMNENKIGWDANDFE